MTAHPETRFTCDRCGDHTYQQVQNTPPHARSAGPASWQVLVIGSDPSTPPTHLCPPCAFGFRAYMSDRTITVATANGAGAEGEATSGRTTPPASSAAR